MRQTTCKRQSLLKETLMLKLLKLLLLLMLLLLLLVMLPLWTRTKVA
eukprot:COSAG02_NODE_3827_length_6178_cov_2.492186_2_plen_47_part_00